MSLGARLARETVAVVLAGGRGSRLAPLTHGICKPALPFAGALRTIDFSLANCVNSGISAVGVTVRYRPDALLAHLAAKWAGRAVPWRSEESLPPLDCGGTAAAVYRNLARIATLRAALVLVLSGDHVYKMDYRPMLAAHRTSGAAVTVGCVEVPLEEARRFGVVEATDDGRIVRFLEKPQLAGERYGRRLASMGIYVFDAEFLANALAADSGRPGSRHDFGIDILPWLVDRARVFAFSFRGLDGSGRRGYWRDVGTLPAFWQAHMDLLGPAPLLTLDDPAWPIGDAATCLHIIATAERTTLGGEIEQSIVCDADAVAGRVRRSVLSGGVTVACGTAVEESVLLTGAAIDPDVRLRGVIVDAGHRVAAGTVVERNAATAGPLVLSVHAGREPLLEPEGGVTSRG